MTRHIYPNDSQSTARKKAYKTAYEEAFPLEDLITPQEVDSNAESWGDVPREELDREVEQSLTTIRHERHYDGIHKDLATLLYMHDLPRAPMEHLAFETKQEALQEGYWPNSMTNVEAHQQILENDVLIPPEYYNEAWSEVSAGIYDKTHPRESSRYDE